MSAERISLRPWTHHCFMGKTVRTGLIFVCVSRGCHNKLPQTRCLKNNRNLFAHSSGDQKSGINGSVRLIPSGGSGGRICSMLQPPLHSCGLRGHLCLQIGLLGPPPDYHPPSSSPSLSITLCICQGSPERRKK